MKKTLKVYLLVLIIAPLVANGQEQRKVYFDEYHRKLPDAKYYRIYTPENNLYKVDEYLVSDNTLTMTGHCTTPDSESRTGVFTFYKDGFKSSEGKYEQNKFAGRWTHYYDSSFTLWYSAVYENDKLYELTSYYKDKKVKRREFHDSQGEISGNCYDENGKEIPFTVFKKMPEPHYDLDRYLSRKIDYPVNAREHNISGRVIVQFVVDTDGTIGNVKVIKGIGGGCDEEAAGVIAAMPYWNSGYLDDKPVKILFTKPINFTMQ
jgi:TonB family protein